MFSSTSRNFIKGFVSNSANRPLIAVCQLTSTHDVEQNFRIISTMIERAKQRNAQMVFLPECFDYVGRTREENISLAVDEEGEYIGRYRQLAKTSGLWISLGGFHHKDPNNIGKPFNTHLIIDNEGRTRGRYQKLHLFDLDIPGKVRLVESEFSSAGNKIERPVQTPIGNVALSICYDVRFSELALLHRHNGAHILTYPSAFTLNTGLAHWETLLRARAIETQCFVVAAAQTGKHNEKRVSYGHSMVVDPWGTIIAQCSDVMDMCFCEISLDYLNEVRAVQPVFSHRRNDLYCLIAHEKQEIGDKSFTFGDNIIDADYVFYQSSHCFAFVNHSPVLPGRKYHTNLDVLVCPKRQVIRLLELEDFETADIFMAAKRIQTILEAHYSASSSSVCVQDGPDSGQTIKHVHVHILPRKKGDFDGNPDRLYKELVEHDKSGKVKQIRNAESMREEAATYRNLLSYSA
ncbi:unnamed protein product [Dracunculus medinensis]|uniref:Nitrilase and fragile histidine triad fusion protein NitFhit n=1 Tax=Dracunculus medinensis TaxID=318479 RepID=A0A0N4U5B1_DRAME|nr:unnamed protein product [Dracunculus medinensis]